MLTCSDGDVTMSEPVDSDRLQKILLFVLGTMHELRLKGYVQGTDNSPDLTDEGMSQFYHLRASGFTATNEEILWTVTLFRRMDDEDGSTPPATPAPSPAPPPPH